MMPRIAVLGAGLAGLSAAWNLAAHGCTVEVFERDTGVGERAQSISAGWAAADAVLARQAPSAYTLSRLEV